MTNSAEVCRGESPSSAKSDLLCDPVTCDELSDYEGVNIQEDKLELASSAEQVPNTLTKKIINRLEGKIENLSWGINCNNQRSVERY